MFGKLKTKIYLFKQNNVNCQAVVAWFVKASVFHSVNSAPSASGGSNPAWVWHIDLSEVETLCSNSNCRAPGAAFSS